MMIYLMFKLKTGEVKRVEADLDGHDYEDSLYVYTKEGKFSKKDIDGKVTEINVKSEEGV